ncbi:MAG TPA: type II toxin-antitoxin system PemK/MazF family toxin [Terriglobales bacterium]|jgi:mRNA interferase MazF|nr:type II toxin-antitoxin system PemK/MazF family toxin [Terriglobales bacterium]
MEKGQTLVPKRGDVYLVSFDPTLGAEIRKTRPAVIIQNDVANHFSPLTIVAAISSKFDEPLYPTEALVRAGEAGLRSDSVVLLNQIRTIDKSRLARHLGSLRAATLLKVDRALLLSLGLVRL